jgi:hypothetical protein
MRKLVAIMVLALVALMTLPALAKDGEIQLQGDEAKDIELANLRLMVFQTQYNAPTKQFQEKPEVVTTTQQINYFQGELQKLQAALFEKYQLKPEEYAIDVERDQTTGKLLGAKFTKRAKEKK